MQKLSKLSLLLFFIFFIVSCSGKNQENKVKLEDIPTAPDIIFGGVSDKNLSFDDFIKNAMTFYQTKDSKSLNAYITEYEKQFTTPSQKEELTLLKGLVSLTDEDYIQAQKIFNSLSTNTDKSLKGRSYFYLAEITRLQKDYKKAVELYKKANQLYPSVEIDSSIADTYAQLQDWDNAITYYKKAAKANPTQTEDLYFLGAAYYQKKDYKNSEATMHKVLEINPKSTQAYQYLAHIAQNKKDTRNYYYYMSRELLLKKDYATTVTLLENVDLVYKDKDLAPILISSLVHNKQMEKALDVYERSIAKNPKLKQDINFKVYYGVLSVIPKQGKQAGEEYFKALAIAHPNDFLAVTSYADLLSSINKEDPRLESLYLQALFIEPTDTANRYKLSELYNAQNKQELAQLEYGILYYYQDQKDAALESLLNLESKSKDLKNIQLFLYIGLLYQERGQKDLAMQYYKKAQKIDKNNPLVRYSIKKLTDKT